jgi:hypothetical protein
MNNFALSGLPETEQESKNKYDMKNHFFAIFLFLLLALSSCSHYYYTPNSNNIPMFQEKNDLRLSIGTGGGSLSSLKTMQVQGAYSVTDHWALASNFMSVREGSKDEDTSSSWAKGKYFEGAIGYYRSIHPKGVFEVFAGFGSSNQHHQYEYNSYNGGTSDLSFSKVFIQPSVGFTFKYFDIGLAARISSLSFNKINDQMVQQHGEYDELQAIMQNRNSILLEPGLVMRTGWEYVKLQFQFGLCQNLSHPNLEFKNENMSLSLYLTLAPELWK